MIKEIVKDDELLSQPCEKATEQDAELVADLLDTLAANEEAAALSANQIGSPKSVVVYLDDNEQPRVMFNPVLKQALHPFKAVEACLSHDGEVEVKRFAWINVSYDELVDGKLVPKKIKLQGWTAQLVQHMIDHCKGKTI